MGGPGSVEFRNSFGAAMREFGVAAACALFMALLLKDGARVAGPAWLTMFLVGGAALAGVAAVVEIIRQLRERVLIERDGVRIGVEGELIPWTRIEGLRSMGARGELQLVGRPGESLGRIPVSLDGFGQAVLCIAQGDPSRPTTAAVFHGVGTFGVRGWLLLIPLVAMIFWDWFQRSSREVDRSLLVLVAIPVVLPLVHVIRSWRRTGDFIVTVDSARVRFEGRAGAWSAGWGEIANIDPDFDHHGTRTKKVLHLHLKDGVIRQLPYEGLDLAALISALRHFGGEAAKMLAPAPLPSSLPSR